MIRVLDLFCGEGGAGAGYHEAGADVLGVDTDPARLEMTETGCRLSIPPAYTSYILEQIGDSL